MELIRPQRTLGEAVDLAEEGAKHPAFSQVINQVNPGARWRHQVNPGARWCHHDVGDGKVDDEVIGWRVHSLVACNDEQHGHVTNQRQQNDNAVHRRLQRQQLNSFIANGRCTQQSWRYFSCEFISRLNFAHLWPSNRTMLHFQTKLCPMGAQICLRAATPCLRDVDSLSQILLHGEAIFTKNSSQGQRSRWNAIQSVITSTVHVNRYSH